MTAMVATKTNERPGTRAQVRFVRMSASKARAVLDLIRGLPVHSAEEVLDHGERAAAVPIRKLLASAVANAEHNDELDGETLYISACYADEGPTLKRWRPRARGRATRIRKRTCHITIIVSPMPEDMLARYQAERATGRPGGSARRRADEARRARVARSRQAQGAEPEPEPDDTDEPDTEEPDETVDADEVAVDETGAPQADTEEAQDEADQDDTDEAKEK